MAIARYGDTMIQVGLAVLAICAVTSTAAGRSEVRQKLRPLTVPLAIATALIWAAVIIWR